MRKLFALALLLPALALATEGMPLDVDQVLAHQREIRSKVQDSTQYRGLEEARRNELLSRQDALLRLLEDKRGGAPLAPKDQLHVFNEVQWIDGVLNDAEAERLVCRQERRVGSNRMTRVCRTAAQIERQREAARDTLSNGRSACTTDCMLEN